MRPFRLLAHRLPRSVALRMQTRSARIVNARFFQSRVEPRVVDKYREKLEQKIKTEGVNSLEELKDKYADKIAEVRKASAASPSVEKVLAAMLNTTPFSSSSTASHQTFQPPPSPLSPTNNATNPVSAAARNASTAPGVKTLSSFIDTDKLLAHTDHNEISLIWRARFVSNPNSLSATIPAATFMRMLDLARKHPMFILPLPRPNGAELHLMQWTFSAKDQVTLIFTSLAEYKLRGEFATPHTTLTHHMELAEKRGIVLAQGTVMEDRGVTMEQAGLLMNWVQRFYGAVEAGEEEGRRRRRLLEMFTRGDEGFKVEELLEEVEKAV